MRYPPLRAALWRKELRLSVARCIQGILWKTCHLRFQQNSMYLKLFKLSKKSQIREEAEPLLPTRRQRRHPVSSLLRFHRCKSQTWRRTDGDKQQNKSHQDPHPTQSHPLPLSLFITWVLVWVFLCAGPTLSRPNDSRRCSRSPWPKLSLRKHWFDHFATDLGAAAHCDAKGSAFLEERDKT